MQPPHFYQATTDPTLTLLTQQLQNINQNIGTISQKLDNLTYQLNEHKNSLPKLIQQHISKAHKDLISQLINISNNTQPDSSKNLFSSMDLPEFDSSFDPNPLLPQNLFNNTSRLHISPTIRSLANIHTLDSKILPLYGEHSRNRALDKDLVAVIQEGNEYKVIAILSWFHRNKFKLRNITSWFNIPLVGFLVPRYGGSWGPLAKGENTVEFRPIDSKVPFLMVQREELPQEFIKEPIKWKNKVIVCGIKTWYENFRFPLGKYIGVLGDAWEKKVEYLVIKNVCLGYDVDSESIIEEVIDIKQWFIKEEKEVIYYKGGIGISLREKENKIGIHVVDYSKYIEEGSDLEKELKETVGEVGKVGVRFLGRITGDWISLYFNEEGYGFEKSRFLERGVPGQEINLVFDKIEEFYKRKEWVDWRERLEKKEELNYGSYGKEDIVLEFVKYYYNLCAKKVLEERKKRCIYAILKKPKQLSDRKSFTYQFLQLFGIEEANLHKLNTLLYTNIEPLLVSPKDTNSIRMRKVAHHLSKLTKKRRKALLKNLVCLHSIKYSLLPDEYFAPSIVPCSQPSKYLVDLINQRKLISLLEEDYYHTQINTPSENVWEEERIEEEKRYLEDIAERSESFYEKKRLVEQDIKNLDICLSLRKDPTQSFTGIRVSTGVYVESLDNIVSLSKGTNTYLSLGEKIKVKLRVNGGGKERKRKLGFVAEVI
eukprot:snap_masked-scaffold_9-processed-gene-13.71-mRNA-1 protein AED:1.00 eAED:1.00 QI:0/0/0/0/1/1/2/0/710